MLPAEEWRRRGSSGEAARAWLQHDGPVGAPPPPPATKLCRTHVSPAARVCLGLSSAAPLPPRPPLPAELPWVWRPVWSWVPLLGAASWVLLPPEPVGLPGPEPALHRAQRAAPSAGASPGACSGLPACAPGGGGGGGAGHLVGAAMRRCPPVAGLWVPAAATPRSLPDAPSRALYALWAGQGLLGLLADTAASPCAGAAAAGRIALHGPSQQRGPLQRARRQRAGPASLACICFQLSEVLRCPGVCGRRAAAGEGGGQSVSAARLLRGAARRGAPPAPRPSPHPAAPGWRAGSPRAARPAWLRLCAGSGVFRACVGRAAARRVLRAVLAPSQPSVQQRFCDVHA